MANILTLFRANLPVTGTALGRWLGLAALATDFVDGRLARHTGTTTSFGRYADPLADTAYWTWHAFVRGSGTARAAAMLIWLTPTMTVITRSFHQGQMVEMPRPRWIRPAAALQIVLAADDLRSHPDTKTGRRARRL